MSAELKDRQHLQLLHAEEDKTGIARADVGFVVKCCKNCAFKLLSCDEAFISSPFVTSRAWERVQSDLTDMRHIPPDQ